MKNGLLKSVVFGVLAAGALCVGTARADVSVTVSGSDPYLGFMNVFELPSNGGGYVFGSAWVTGDLVAVFTGNNLRLSPNSIGDPNPFWYIGGGGPGAPGNKIMEANMYVEPVAFSGQTVTFSGDVLSNDLATSHVARAFIKDFAPDFSSSVTTSIVLPPSGNWSLSLATINDPGRHVQYGFQMVGPCVWITDVAGFGSVVVGPAQTTPTSPSTWGRLKAQYK